MINRYLRGTVWWCNYYSSNRGGSVMEGCRPVVIVSNNVGNSNSNICIVVPVTSKEKPASPTHVKLEMDNVRGTILCEQIFSVSQEHLGDYICTLSAEIVNKVGKSLVASLDLEGKYSKYSTSVDLEELHKIANKVENLFETYKQMRKGFSIIEYDINQLYGLHGRFILKEGEQKINVSSRSSRSIEEIKDFIHEWEDKDNSRKDVIEAFNFKNYAGAYQYYKYWKKKLEG